MDLSAKGAEFIRHHEGFVAQYYLDPVGIPTIGIGFTWGSASFREWWRRNRPGQTFGPGAQMTRAEADAALKFLVKAEYGAAVERHLGRAVPQHVFDGAVSPVYNLGVGALEWKWAQALKRGDWAEAARLLRTTGTTAKGKTLAGLVSRRREEAELIEVGDYTIGPAATVPDPMADGILARRERGAAVRALQESLAALGLYAGALDGIFGFGTEAAVLKFQRASGLTADGLAGPLTLAALNRAVSLFGRQPDDPGVVPPPDKSQRRSGLNPAGAVIIAFILALASAGAFFFPKLFP